VEKGGGFGRSMRCDLCAASGEAREISMLWLSLRGIGIFVVIRIIVWVDVVSKSYRLM
jgi:hypothetical protein